LLCDLCITLSLPFVFSFSMHDPSSSALYTLSLHDALPILSANINSKYFFFQSQHCLTPKFSNIWKLNFKRFFLFLCYKVKQRHPTLYGLFLFLCCLIHNRSK